MDMTKFSTLVSTTNAINAGSSAFDYTSLGSNFRKRLAKLADTFESFHKFIYENLKFMIDNSPRVHTTQYCGGTFYHRFSTNGGHTLLCRTDPNDKLRIEVEGSSAWHDECYVWTWKLDDSSFRSDRKTLFLNILSGDYSGITEKNVREIEGIISKTETYYNKIFSQTLEDVLVEIKNHQENRHNELMAVAEKCSPEVEQTPKSITITISYK